jgi:tetratricopeptide (TPR) repeat protein
MQNIQPNFLTKFTIFSLFLIQSFNCQADKFSLQTADSLFASNNYQEALQIYEHLLLEEEVYAPAMLLKMAFVAEGMGDFSKASYYLAKFYDTNPNPRVITKIKTLTEQSELYGYELSDWDRFFGLLTDLRIELTSGFAFLLVVSLILLIVFREKAIRPKYYLPSFALLFLVFLSNNFLYQPRTGIVTGSPTLLMEKPTAASKVVSKVDPGHRVVIKSTKDVWHEVAWKNGRAYIKKDNITRL